MLSRFDYVKYDEHATRDQAEAKDLCQELEAFIDTLPPEPAEKALQHLEECYMWIGKAIRDEQIKRNRSAPLQEERNEG